MEILSQLVVTVVFVLQFARFREELTRFVVKKGRKMVVASHAAGDRIQLDETMPADVTKGNTFKRFRIKSSTEVVLSSILGRKNFATF